MKEACKHLFLFWGTRCFTWKIFFCHPVIPMFVFLRCCSAKHTGLFFVCQLDYMFDFLEPCNLNMHFSPNNLGFKWRGFPDSAFHWLCDSVMTRMDLLSFRLNPKPRIVWVVGIVFQMGWFNHQLVMLFFLWPFMVAGIVLLWSISRQYTVHVCSIHFPVNFWGDTRSLLNMNMAPELLDFFSRTFILTWTWT